MNLDVVYDPCTACGQPITDANFDPFVAKMFDEDEFPYHVACWLLDGSQ